MSTESQKEAASDASSDISNHLSKIESERSKSGGKNEYHKAFCRGAKSPVFMATVSNCLEERRHLLTAFMEVLPAESYGKCLQNSELCNDLLPGLRRQRQVKAK